MREQQQLNYNRIAEAIDFVHQNFRNQPSLDEIAVMVHLSPFHFQRLFKDWAGVSPKKFLQYISVNHGKSLLQTRQQNLFDAALDVGLSGTGRLHDLFVLIEGMTPGEYKNGGENLKINFCSAHTQFETILTAATLKGLCYIGFSDENNSAIDDLKSRFPKASFFEKSDGFQQDALDAFGGNWSKIKLHLKGTDFQLKVWEALLKIPLWQLSTYGAQAKKIEKPKASRAVGTAIGCNPIAFLIPYHRVIQSSGAIGGYMWGPNRKTAVIGWEAAKISTAHE
jgi:AraC family transcriptional regulator of adaptative response/methylated-DNA-[protein]-cysteine methyltransferase